MHARYLIIGNGVAGINAAKALAQNGSEGEIVVYSAERYHYYNRWQLPALLAGEKKAKDIYFYAAEWYRQRGIQVHLDLAVQAIDPAAKRVTLADGQQIGYDSLLLATGGLSFVPPIAGTEKRGVFTLRGLDDAVAIKEYAASVGSAVVVGGGLLGLETAHSLRALGLEVTAVEFFPRLLPRQLDAPGSALFQEIVEGLGIQVVTDASTERILGGERAAGVQVSGDRTIRGEMIVISAGMRPNIRLAREASLEVGRGVIVNEWLETSAPDIYAAGDVAEYNGQVYGIIPAAIEQAQVAAARMMDAEAAPYRGTIPSTTLKVANIDLTCIGVVHPEDPACTELRTENRDKGLYRKLVLRESRIIGSILLGDKKNVAPITKLIKEKTHIAWPVEQLLRENFDFRELLSSAPSPKASRYECVICGYIYGSDKGDPENNIPPGTPFESLPGGWACPLCGAAKSMFSKLE